MVPLSADERIMIDDYIPMLNANSVPKGLFNRVKDIFTAYIYTQKAQDTEAKEIMLDTLSSILSGEDT